MIFKCHKCVEWCDSTKCRTIDQNYCFFEPPVTSTTYNYKRHGNLALLAKICQYMNSLVFLFQGSKSQPAQRESSQSRWGKGDANYEGFIQPTHMAKSTFLQWECRLWLCEHDTIKYNVRYKFFNIFWWFGYTLCNIFHVYMSF